MDAKIEKLKEKLRKYDTADLLGMISIHFMTFASDGDDFAIQSDIFNKTDLISPQKQYLYLAGLLMSTDNLSNGAIHNGTSEFQELEKDVQEITLEYAQNFLDVDMESVPTNSDTIKRNLVSWEAFISYFDTGVLRYDEQTEELLHTLYSPFDTELMALTKLCIA